MIYLAAACAVLAFCAVITGGFGLYFGLQAWAKVQAMEKSTHSIQYVPLDDGKAINKQIDDIEDEMYRDLGSREHLEEIEALS